MCLFSREQDDIQGHTLGLGFPWVFYLLCYLQYIYEKSCKSFNQRGGPPTTLSWECPTKFVAVALRSVVSVHSKECETAGIKNN